MCKHIYGFDEGYSDPSDQEYESPGLVYDKKYMFRDVAIVFNYCPLCGKEL